MVNPIEGLGQSLSCGFVSIRPQFKEFIYSYFPFSDCFIGSLYYFTTGLHGFHVRCGSFGLFPILLYSSSSSFNFCASYSILIDAANGTAGLAVFSFYYSLFCFF